MPNPEKEFIQLIEEGNSAVWDQDWEKAASIFTQAIEIDRDASA